MSAALLVVDMSEEQAGNLTFQKDKLISTIQRLAASQRFDVIIDSRLWLSGPSDSTLSLSYPDCGVSLGVAGSLSAGLVPELKCFDMDFVAK